MRAAFFLVLTLFVSLPAAGADTRPPEAAVASAHPLATAAGREILAAGGNAFDAAVAVSAALAVVEPYSSGLGGGGFWLLHRADGSEVMVDGRERAPLAATRGMFLDASGAVVPQRSVDGALAAGIPGEPAALVHIAGRYGRLPLARSLAPAVRLAREGFPVTPHYRRMAEWRAAVLRQDAAASALFLDAGQVPALGHRILQPDLARTLELLGREGRAGFYGGETAERLLGAVKAAGGIWHAQDLDDYRVAERKPLIGEYRGIRVTSAAPPSAGGVGLITLLNILAGYDLDKLPAATRDHLTIEAMRRAYRDRAEYLGDPDQVQIPLDRLLHPFYADGLRASIRTDRATPSAALPGATEPPGGNHTTHLSVLDTEGNYVAATLSINYPFGSGVVAGGTGVLLNDELDDFAASPGAPNVYGLVGGEANAVAPGRRMLSSMTPTFLDDGGRVGILGTPGGSRIISMVLLGVLEFASGKGPKAWVERPRFHHQFLPDEVVYEPGAFDAQEAADLAARGHRLREVEPYGNMQAVQWDRSRGRVEAASDPRGEGAAEVIAGSAGNGPAAPATP